MDYYSKYKDYMNLSTSSNNITDSTKEIVNSNFNNAYFTETILIEDVEYKAIVKQEKKSENKKIILKPNVKIDVGSTIKIGSSTYLTLDFLGEGVYEIYPTAILKLCNSEFEIKSEDKIEFVMENGKVKTDIYGRPIQKKIKGEVRKVPCIVETNYYYNNRNEQITLPSDRIMITMKYHDSVNISINEHFEMYNSKFFITFVDYSKCINNEGVITIMGERVVKD